MTNMRYGHHCHYNCHHDHDHHPQSSFPPGPLTQPCFSPTPPPKPCARAEQPPTHFSAWVVKDFRRQTPHSDSSTFPFILGPEIVLPVLLAAHQRIAEHPLQLLVLLQQPGHLFHLPPVSDKFLGAFFYLRAFNTSLPLFSPSRDMHASVE